MECETLKSGRDGTKDDSRTDDAGRTDVKVNISNKYLDVDLALFVTT